MHIPCVFAVPESWGDPEDLGKIWMSKTQGICLVSLMDYANCLCFCYARILGGPLGFGQNCDVKNTWNLLSQLDGLCKLHVFLLCQNPGVTPRIWAKLGCQKHMEFA